MRGGAVRRQRRTGSRVRLAAAGSILAAVLSGAGPAYAYPTEVAVLRGLDKVTARVSKFEATIGVPVQFGTLHITLRHCERTPPEEPPESKAFLEIVEARAGETPVAVFSGWMFASSPALSALEHPVYVVWVLECRKPAAEQGETKPAD